VRHGEFDLQSARTLTPEDTEAHRVDLGLPCMTL
jgi:hypothetical protein